MTENTSFRYGRYAVSLALLGVLFYKVDSRELVSDLERLTFIPVLLIVGLSMGQVIATSLRWQLLLKSAHIHLPYRVVTEINVISILANTVLINVIGGMAAKVALLAGRNVATHVTLATLILERALIFAVLVSMAVIGLWLLPLPITTIKVPYIALAPLLLVLALLALVLRESQLLRRLMQAVWRYARLVLDGVFQGAQARWAVAHSFLLSILSQVLVIVMGVAIALALGINVPLFDLVMLLPVVSLLASLPISIAGLGVREVSLVYILSLYAVPMEQAMLFSVLILIFSILGAGAVFLALKALKLLWPDSRAIG